MENPVLISIRNLSLRSKDQILIHDLSLDIYENEILGVAGESGSGKTLLFRTLLSILPEDVSFQAEKLELFGTDLLGLSPSKWRTLSGSHIGLVPQNTQEYLHPDFRIRNQILDSFLSFHKGSRPEALEKARKLLSEVGFSDPERILNSYPFQLSGGMRQRVNVAMALMNDPELLIADEPTTALDAGIARQILELFRKLQQERGISVVIISHNLQVLRQYSTRSAILYAGRILELGSTQELFRNPAHPYTEALLDIVPPLGEAPAVLPEIPGFVPDSGRETEYCIFAPRCPKYLAEHCDLPQTLLEIDKAHYCRCSHLPFRKDREDHV